MGIVRRLFGATGEESQSFQIPSATADTIGLVASPDSKRLAYAIRTRRRMRVEVNGRRGRQFDAVFGVILANNSLAYVAARGNRRFVVFNEQEHDSWHDIGKTGPTISPDSHRVAYTARRGRDWYANIDGSVVAGPYEGFAPGGILFSPDSKRFAYVIKSGDSWLAVVDGLEHTPFPALTHRTLIFSPDSRKVAYVAAVGRCSRLGQPFVGESAVVVDTVPGRTWLHDETSGHGLSADLAFSPDSKRLAYEVIEGPTSIVVVDDDEQSRYGRLVSGWKGSAFWKRSPGYGQVGNRSRGIVFSPDSRHIAYAANAGQQHVLVFDGQELARGDSRILSHPPCFSPDSRHLAYGVEEGGEQSVVLDDRKLRSHVDLPQAEWSFSPDSATLAYLAGENMAGRHSFVVGNDILQLHGRVVTGARVVWDDNEHLHSLIAGVGRATCIKVMLDPSRRPTLVSE